MKRVLLYIAHLIGTDLIVSSTEQHRQLVKTDVTVGTEGVGWRVLPRLKARAIEEIVKLCE